MITATVLARARLALNDPDVSPRWTTANLTNYVTDGVSVICARRPEFRLSTDGTLSAVSITLLPDNMIRALVAYVCAKALAEDDSDKINAQQAQWYNEAFEKSLYGD